MIWQVLFDRLAIMDQYIKPAEFIIPIRVAGLNSETPQVSPRESRLCSDRLAIMILVSLQ
jgi:hypothetical protein